MFEGEWEWVTRRPNNFISIVIDDGLNDGDEVNTYGTDP